MSGGIQYLSGGQAVFTTVSSGAGQIVYSGGLGFETFISSGGFQYVQSGGIALSAGVYSGGHQYVYLRGVASATQIQSGGTAYTYAGGVNSFDDDRQRRRPIRLRRLLFRSHCDGRRSICRVRWFHLRDERRLEPNRLRRRHHLLRFGADCGRRSVFIRRDRRLHQAVRRRRPGCLYRRTGLRGPHLFGRLPGCLAWRARRIRLCLFGRGAECLRQRLCDRHPVRRHGICLCDRYVRHHQQRRRAIRLRLLPFYRHSRRRRSVHRVLAATPPGPATPGRNSSTRAASRPTSPP